MMNIKDDALIKEYELLVQLYIHEDSLFWKLVDTFIISNSTLFSVMVIVASLDTSFNIDFILLSLCSIGVALNFIHSHIFQRNMIYREARLNKALYIENVIKVDGTKVLDIFTENEKLISEKKLCTQNGNSRELKRFEKIGTSCAFPLIAIVAGILWILGVVVIFAFQVSTL